MGKKNETGAAVLSIPAPVAPVAEPAPAPAPVAPAGPVVDKTGVERVFYRYANLDGKRARLFSALCGSENPARDVADMSAFIDDIRAMARTGASKAFTFPDGHALAGKTGRDALNAITDDRESNGAIRTAVKKNYK